MNRNRSHDEWQRAQRVLAGGVNSPVRAFGAVGGDPIFFESGDGAIVRDVDGNEYVDYVLSWGPLILGHRHPAVIRALELALTRGTTFGAPTIAETDLAEELIACTPSLEVVRMVSSGTEAAMSAIRLARGFTGRDGIVKFDGCYHGHADALLVAAGSGAATFSIPGSRGVPKRAVEHSHVAPFNDGDAVKKLLREKGDEIAVVAVEPVAGNMGLVPPEPGFLELLRAETERAGTLLLFDEVMTGFRLGLSSAQGRLGVTPDLTALAKVVGGGLPLGAYGGSAAVMKHLAPGGAVYQAGTLSGNPLAVAAGLATVRELRATEPYAAIEKTAGALETGLLAAADRAGVPVRIQREGTMMSLYFREGPVRDYEDAKSADQERFARFHRGMRDRGIYLPPSQFEAYFLSTEHGEAEIERTIEAAAATFADIASGRS
ncbi:MAG: glutamate-1-semialdehyde 2,1-aminomutase [Gemmatimonadetes bacterium]|nr:glutamate-1-semialdehyde 2,1-aminomutase [Gemmatimonadota bacterium]